MKKTIGMVAWLLIGVVGSACAGSPSVESVPPATRGALTDLLNRPPELVRATAKATAACMREHGFQYPPYEASTSQQAGNNLDSIVRSRSLTVDYARHHGYGHYLTKDDVAPGESAGSHVEEYLASLSPSDQTRYQELLEGSEEDDPVELELPNGAIVSTSSEGCIGQGRKGVYGTIENYLTITYLPQHVWSYVDNAAQDPQVRRAQGAYLNCMADAGYPAVNSVAHAIDVASQRFSRDTPLSDAERDMAVADATCQEQSGIHSALDDAVVRKAATWLNNHESEILGAAEIQRDAIERARQVLDTELPPPSA